MHFEKWMKIILTSNFEDLLRFLFKVHITILGNGYLYFFSFYNMRHLQTFFKNKNNLLKSQNSIFQKNSLAKHNSNPPNFKISLQKLYLCIVSIYLSIFLSAVKLLIMLKIPLKFKSLLYFGIF